MAFTADELASISAAVLDYHQKQKRAEDQTIQSKPLLRALRAKQKTFPGGKDNITVRVKGVRTTTIEGYTHNDQVSYGNPANIKEAQYPWKEVHAGMACTMTELKKAGISITDSANGKGETRHSEQEKFALIDLLQDKLEDMDEGYEEGMNEMLWLDGSQDSLEVPGIRSIIVDDPTAAALVGGLDQNSLTWWRNRAVLGTNAGTPANQALTNVLNKEIRQLRRYAPGSRLIWLAGSDFLDALEQEVRALGNYTESGWAKSGGLEIGTGDLKLKGTMFEYDPTLDDLGLAKRCYAIDTKSIRLRPMQGEDGKLHNPARPEDQYVIYRAKTWTGGMDCIRRNSSGVYSIA